MSTKMNDSILSASLVVRLSAQALAPKIHEEALLYSPWSSPSVKNKVTS